MARQQAKLHVGTSGYQYDEWRGRFYPEELPKSAWFAHYAEHFDAFLEAAPKGIRWAVEFRDPSWLCEDIYALLRTHGASLCIHDLIERHPRVRTANWVYLRFHGREYAGSYSPQALSATARRIRTYLADGNDVYAFFNNDIGGHAVRNAADLRRALLAELQVVLVLRVVGFELVGAFEGSAGEAAIVEF